MKQGQGLKIMSCFELGPIRPPSEAESVLLRLTRNCHWNRCAFCPVYKNTRFSMRSVEEVKKDIEVMARIAGIIRAELDRCYPDRKDDTPVARLIKDLDFGEEIDRGCARQVAFWIYYGMKSLFLQDADALVHRTPGLLEILGFVREKFPTIERITTYTRADTVSRKSLEDLVALRKAGLNRVHIGMESGSDRVLELINKGVTRDQAVRAGRNVIEAGFELSEYYMPGLGGRDFSEEHARESAAVLNEVNPTFIRLRSTIPVPGTPLHEMMTDGRWHPLTEEERVREIRLFIENLDGITSAVRSDHVMNLLEDVEGDLPEGKESMLRTLDRFLEMSADDRELFIVGRRTGRYRYLRDYVPSQDVGLLRDELKRRFGSVDEGVLGILAAYI
ncbi:MAG: radical SAM protein [Spirochaetes bacterium]|nr:radical SAM protein [Spirochaetota bacterium]